MEATEKSNDATITVAKGKSRFNIKKIGRSLFLAIGTVLAGFGLVYSVGRIQSCKVDQDRIESERVVRENQKAHIRVQYSADGHAVNCWVTQDDGVRINGPSAEIYMTNWHDYKEFATELGIDPEKCTILWWDGRQGTK